MNPLFQTDLSRLEKLFSDYTQNLPSIHLQQAMQYTLSNGGKRIRPALVYATGSLFDSPATSLDIAASAVELIHTYSLIHDDLPCMDNADLRRGKPSCHKMAGEAMAVLAGDALQPLAFQIIAEHPSSLTSQQRLAMIQTLSRAAGPEGMVAGQALDMYDMRADTLETIYRLKTGDLLSASILLGALTHPDLDQATLASLKLFGERLGLAFQIQDDLLDMETETAVLGKPQNLDEQNHKITYPRVHGLENARNKIQSLYQEATALLTPFGEKADRLREVMDCLVGRVY